MSVDDNWVLRNGPMSGGLTYYSRNPDQIGRVTDWLRHIPNAQEYLRPLRPGERVNQLEPSDLLLDAFNEWLGRQG